LDIVDTEIAPNAYELKCTVADIKPPIWRRLRLPGDFTLADLHTVLQDVFNWEDAHLHNFNVDDVEFSEVDDEGDEEPDSEDEADVTLDELELTKKSRILYTYDFGDNWEVQIKVEKIEGNDPNLTAPICLDGARAAPPEDCGGVPGYYNLIEAMSNPKHPDHKELLEWLGYEYDPEAFDLEAANISFAQLVPKPGLPLPWIDRAAERMAKGAADAAATPPTDAEWKALYDAVRRYRDANPWDVLSDQHNEFIRNPETGENGIFAIIGASDDISGFMLYRGERGYDSLWRVNEVGLVDETDLYVTADAIGITFQARSVVSDEEIARFKTHKLKFTGRNAYPLVRAFDPGYSPRQVNGAEARYLSLALTRTIDIVSEHRQNIREVELIELEAATPVHIFENGAWRIGSFEPKLAEINIPVTLLTDNVVNDLQKLTMSDGILEMDFWSFPQALEDKAGRELMPFAITASDADSLEPIGMEIVPFDQVLDTSMKVFIDVLKKVEMRPSVVVVRRPEISQLLIPLADQLNINIILKAELGTSEFTRLSMLAKMAGLGMEDLVI